MTDLPAMVLPHGGYRKLRTFKTAQDIYDSTVIFCNRFVEKGSRTRDQMVQAARSGVQNIAEGSVAAATSKKTEIKLTNVARASLEELLLDYQDYLRQHGLHLWAKDSPEALAVRSQHSLNQAAGSDPYCIALAHGEAAANTMICLINQATYLLRRQISTLEREFLQHGGFTERMYTSRSQVRAESSAKSDESDMSDTSDSTAPPPSCPSCGNPMVLRLARKGAYAGKHFWGCSAFPDCTGTRAVTPE